MYLTGRYYKSGEETAESMSDQYMILDVAAKKLTKHQFSTNERIYAGTAFLRSVIADGKYSIYRSTLDLENEQLVYEVPANQFLDTAKYGMPEQPSFLSAYESDDMIIVHLPLSSDGIPRPSRHGEDGVKIDLRTGKVLYYGDNYGLDEPEESSRNITATIVNGTGAAGTTLSGTTVSSSGTNGTTTASAQTTAAKFTVGADHHDDRVVLRLGDFIHPASLQQPVQFPGRKADGDSVHGHRASLLS